MKVPTNEELQAVQDALDGDGAQIITVGNQLGREAAALVMAASKPIKKMQARLLQEANKHIVTSDNSIDYVTTSLLNGVNTWLTEAGFLLQNFAVKGGIIEPGDPIEKALAQEVADEPQIEYLGTLVLAVKEAVPWLERIACALETIAKNTGGQPTLSPVPVMGEPGGGGAVLGGEEVKPGAAPDFVADDDVALDDGPLAPDATDGSEAAA